MRGGPPAAAFLDRDGTIIEDRGYMGLASDVRMLPRAAAAIRRLNRAGVPVVVVTNQSGIGRGLFDEQGYLTVQAEVERQLGRAGGRLDAAYHCPHDPGRTRCRCRKPQLALYEQAARDLGDLVLARSVFVGDRAHDVEPAARTGGRGFLVRTGQPLGDRLPAACEVVEDLWEAVDRALGETPAHES